MEILSYNIEYGQKLDDVYKWLRDRDNFPDFICLQEFPEEGLEEVIENLPFKKMAYQFAPAFTRKGTVHGELTIFNPAKVNLLESEIIDLGESRFERFYRRSPSNRSALITTFKLKKIVFTIVNIHLLVFALNGRRRKQLKIILENLDHKPTIIVGDFNYTSLLGRGGLIKFMNKSKFKLAGEKMTTNRFKRLRIPQQLDYVFYKGCKLTSIEVNNVRFSDHFPVFANFILD